jgi:hypothetical protein
MNSFHVLDEPCSIISTAEGSWIRKMRGIRNPFIRNYGDIRGENHYDLKKAGYRIIFLSM